MDSIRLVSTGSSSSSSARAPRARFTSSRPAPSRTRLVATLVAATAALVAGCDPLAGGSVGGAGGSGGDTTVPDSCGQKVSCPVSQECLATVSNAGSPQFGLRIAELAMRKPEPFVPGSLPGSLLEWWVGPSLPACAAPSSGLGEGSGTTSWLLRFDLDQRTLTMGSAAPPADPAGGYTFLHDTVVQGSASYDPAPVTFALVTNPDGSLSTQAPRDLHLAMFFDALSGNDAISGPVVLPLHALTVSNVVVSSTHDCIGRYDPADLDPARGCSPTKDHELYQHGGHLDAFVSLEEADAIDFTVIEQSLCVVLTGSAAVNGDGQKPITHCKRTGGVIDFKGDWCSQTNAPATDTCADAVRFTADFAASAVTIHP